MLQAREHIARDGISGQLPLAQPGLLPGLGDPLSKGHGHSSG